MSNNQKAVDEASVEFFSTPTGIMILKYWQTLYCSRTFKKDPFENAYMCGRREVIEEIINNINRLKGV